MRLKGVQSNIRRDYIRLIYLLIIFVLIWANPVTANSMAGRFQHVVHSAADFRQPIGLISTMVQDRHGFMWFGGRELYRFDGRNVVVYLDKPNESCAGLIKGLVVDHQGILWVASTNGVCFFDESQDQFIRFSIPDQSVQINSVHSIHADAAGYLYFGLNGRFAKIPPARDAIEFIDLTGFDKGDSATNDIQGFYFQNTEILWLATRRSGLARYDIKADSFTYFNNKIGMHAELPSNNVLSISGDGHDSLWMGMSNGGISKLNLASSNITHYYNGDKVERESNLYVWHVLVDSEGQVWASADGGGVMQYDAAKDKFIHYKKDFYDPNSVASNKTVFTYEDADKNLWFSYFPLGIDFVNRKHLQIATYIHNPNQAHSLNSSSILSIYESAPRKVWIGSEGGLNLFDPINHTFTNYSKPGDGRWHIGEHPVTSIKGDAQGRLWIGTWGAGVYWVDLESNAVTHFNTSSDTQSVDAAQFWDALIEDRDVLFATENVPGVLSYSIDQGGFKRIESWGDGITYDRAHTFDLHRDSRGHLWIASTEGLFEVSESGFTQLLSDADASRTDRISSFRIRRIFEDSQSVLWFGTENSGLYRYDREGKAFKHVISHMGLETLEVNCISEIHDGSIWAFTNIGIITVSPDGEVVDHIHHGHGLISDYFYRNACYISEENKVYAGGASGLSVFTPEQVLSRSQSFPVHITGIKLYRTDGEKHLVEQRNMLYSDSVQLDYDQTMFTVNFAGLSYSQADNNEFAYRLKGFESSWNHVGTVDEAVYTNIPSGNYIFEVRARSANGVWSDSSDTLLIAIATPPWRSGWAYCLYFLFIVITIYCTWRIRRNQERWARDLAISTERIAMQNEKELALKGFVADVSHELKTPLAILSGEVEAVLDGVRPLTRTSMMSIDEELRLINNLVDDLFDISLSDSGALNYRFEVIDFISVLKVAVDAMDQKFIESNIRVTVSVNLNESRVSGDKDRLLQLLINLFENTCRYTNEGGRLNIECLEKDGRIVLVVEDSDPGVTDDQLIKIFERFYRADGSRNRISGGSGLGLSICQNIILAHEGEIIADHSILGGLKLIVALPLISEKGDL